MEKLMKVECAPECGFAIQSHDEKELVNFVEKHAKAAHHMEMADADVKKRMITV